MRNLNHKPFITIIAVITVILWLGISKVTGLNAEDFYDVLRPLPKVITGDIIFVGLFIKWGWRLKFLQNWLVPFPNLNGTWQGTIQTEWKDAEGVTPGPIPVILTIKQTFGHISCVMRTSEMESQSYVEGFYIDRERQIRQLCYSYTSKPKAVLRSRSTTHGGTVLFRIIGSPVTKLEGEYWTQRQSTGTVTLSFRTKELLEELPSDLPAYPMTPGTES